MANASYYMHTSIASNSRSTYEAAARTYSTFCHQTQVSLFPLSEQKLISFVCSLARRLSYQSIKTYLSGLRFHAISMGYYPKISEMHQLYYVLRGIRRHQGLNTRSQRKSPMSISHISVLFRRSSFLLNSFDACMVQAVSSIAFFGMLRVSEYTSPGVNTYNASVNLTVDDAHIANGVLSLTIKASKTDPFRIGVVIRFASIPSPFCPVALCCSYLRLRGRAPGPLFIFSDGSFLTRSRLSVFIQSVFPSSNLNTHSFRIGGASAAASAGIPDSSIQVLGRWRSDAFLRYLRFSVEDIRHFMSNMVFH